mgnify:CR=1 FL=1
MFGQLTVAVRTWFAPPVGIVAIAVRTLFGPASPRSTARKRRAWLPLNAPPVCTALRA